FCSAAQPREPASDTRSSHPAICQAPATLAADASAPRSARHRAVLVLLLVLGLLLVPARARDLAAAPRSAWQQARLCFRSSQALGLPACDADRQLSASARLSPLHSARLRPAPTASQCQTGRSACGPCDPMVRSE